MVVPTVPAIAGCQSGDYIQDPNKNFLLDGDICISRADGLNALAAGELAWALGARATSVGAHSGQNSGTVEGAISVGAFSNYSSAGIYSIAVGTGETSTTGPGSPGNFSVAVGGGNGAAFTPNGRPEMNLNGAKAVGFLSAAFGTAAQAIGAGSSALGGGSTAVADDSLALGDFSAAAGAGGIAVGVLSLADDRGSVALGRKAHATKPGAIALGENSLANAANTVSVGTSTAPRRIMNVSPAVAAKDAVNLAQAKALIAAAASGSSENLHDQLKELRDLVHRQQDRIARLEARLSLAAQ
jgi:autotransporter adhesin